MQKKINKIKKQIEGITLIALVVTIIVLLILSGVSIATLVGKNGIISMAQKAKDETKIKSIEEEIELWQANNEIEYNVSNGNIQTLEEFVIYLQSKGLLTEDQKEEVLNTGKLTIGKKEIIFQRTTYIENKEDLENFRDNVNNGKSYKNERVILVDNIDLGGIESDSSNFWDPIGSDERGIRFEGTFDGQNHTISNLYMKASGNIEYIALFSSIENATIQNLIVDGNLVAGPNLSEQDDPAAAGIVGVAYGNCKIINCINNAIVSKESAGRECAGILGCVYLESSAILDNCINNGSVSGGNACGGLVGTVYGSLKINNSSNNGKIGNINSSYVAGLLGRTMEGAISIDINDSYNTGEILSIRYSAGILACAVEGDITINNCYNQGKIDATNRVITGAVGGIMARIYKNCSKVNIINCNNISNIIIGSETKKMIVGGILGENQNKNTTIVNCYNVGNLEGDYVSGITGWISDAGDATATQYINIINSYNAGNITGRLSKAGIISLTSDRATVDIQNVYYLETCADVGVQNSTSDNGISLTDSYMKSPNFVDDLNSNIESIQIEEQLKLWKYIESDYPKFE